MGRTRFTRLSYRAVCDVPMRVRPCGTDTRLVRKPDRKSEKNEGPGPFKLAEAHGARGLPSVRVNGYRLMVRGARQGSTSR
ncbi:MAG: hypothetical protein ACRYGA_08320 [Janthinobacterium lividum]